MLNNSAVTVPRRQISVRNQGLDGRERQLHPCIWSDLLRFPSLSSSSVISDFYILSFLQPSSLLTVSAHVRYSRRMAQDHPSPLNALSPFTSVSWTDNCLHCAQEAGVTLTPTHLRFIPQSEYGCVCVRACMSVHKCVCASQWTKDGRGFFSVNMRINLQNYDLEAMAIQTPMTSC